MNNTDKETEEMVPFYVDEWDERLYTIIYGWEETNFKKFLNSEMPDYLI